MTIQRRVTENPAGVPLQYVRNYKEGAQAALIWAVHVTHAGIAEKYGVAVRQHHGSWAVLLVQQNPETEEESRND